MLVVQCVTVHGLGLICGHKWRNERVSRAIYAHYSELKRGRTVPVCVGLQVCAD